MDKVKVALAALRKHHFWVLCGIVVIVALAVWTSATADLVDQFTTRKSTLEGLRSAVQSISSKPDHPNEKTIAATQTQTQLLKGIVFETWKFLYDDQRANNQWPVALGRDFREMIDSLGPDEDIPPQFLERYHNFIIQHFPTLFDIIDIRLPAQLDEQGNIKLDAEGRPMKIDPFATRSSNTEMGVGMVGGQTKWVGKVQWNEADLRRVKAAFDWPVRPTSEQVRLAQEDLWVYEALLRIIRQTNEGATSHYNAAVKRLETMEIGRAAAQSFQNASKRVFGNLSGVGSGMMEGSMMEGDMMMGSDEYNYSSEMSAGMEGGEGSMSGATARAAMLTDFRYVDQNLKPLAGDAEPPFAEFKMMPIHLILVMDQRRIPKLLAACANSSMPVEVRMLSIRPGKGPKISLDRFLRAGQTSTGGLGMSSGVGMEGNYGVPGGYGGGDYGGGYGGGDYGEGSVYGGGTGMMGDSSFGGGRAEGFEPSVYDLPIEILGIIYIFNPPDINKLGTGSADDQSATAPAPTVPSSAPAAAPPADAPAAPPATPPTDAPAAPPATPPAAVPPATAPPATAPPATAPATVPAAPEGGPGAAPGAAPSPAPPSAPAAPAAASGAGPATPAAKPGVPGGVPGQSP